MRNFRCHTHLPIIFLPNLFVNVWNTTEHAVSWTHRNNEVQERQLPDLTTTTQLGAHGDQYQV